MIVLVGGRDRRLWIFLVEMCKEEAEIGEEVVGSWGEVMGS
jgi:hypothetical protein